MKNKTTKKTQKAHDRAPKRRSEGTEILITPVLKKAIEKPEKYCDEVELRPLFKQILRELKNYKLHAEDQETYYEVLRILNHMWELDNFAEEISTAAKRIKKKDRKAKLFIKYEGLNKSVYKHTKTNKYVIKFWFLKAVWLLTVQLLFLVSQQQAEERQKMTDKSFGRQDGFQNYNEDYYEVIDKFCERKYPTEKGREPLKLLEKLSRSRKIVTNENFIKEFEKINFPDGKTFSDFLKLSRNAIWEADYFRFNKKIEQRVDLKKVESSPEEMQEISKDEKFKIYFEKDEKKWLIPRAEVVRTRKKKHIEITFHVYTCENR